MPKLSVPPRSSRTSQDDVARLLDPGEHALGLRPQRPPRLRQRDPAADAREELDAELRLELADLLGERRLGDVERAGGCRERAVLRGGEEISELAKIHRYRPIDMRARIEYAFAIVRPYRGCMASLSHPARRRSSRSRPAWRSRCSPSSGSSRSTAAPRSQASSAGATPSPRWCSAASRDGPRGHAAPDGRRRVRPRRRPLCG